VTVTIDELRSWWQEYIVAARAATDDDTPWLDFDARVRARALEVWDAIRAELEDHRDPLRWTEEEQQQGQPTFMSGFRDFALVFASDEAW
jgi:hypothetical protein